MGWEGIVRICDAWVMWLELAKGYLKSREIKGLGISFVKEEESVGCGVGVT
jgi:hypothetical protein